MDTITLLSIVVLIMLTNLYISSKWKRARNSCVEFKRFLDEYAAELDQRAAELDGAQRGLVAWGQALAERDDMLSGYFTAVADEVSARDEGSEQ